jgi:hypothetical protein
MSSAEVTNVATIAAMRTSSAAVSAGSMLIGQTPRTLAPASEAMRVASLQIACDSGETTRSRPGVSGRSCTAPATRNSSEPASQMLSGRVGCAVFVRSRVA